MEAAERSHLAQSDKAEFGERRKLLGRRPNLWPPPPFASIEMTVRLTMIARGDMCCPRPRLRHTGKCRVKKHESAAVLFALTGA
jgi:hypothetical protein